jgi:hypothetical protein
MVDLLTEYGGYRTTADGRRVRRDEPDEDLEMKQAEQIRKNQLSRMNKRKPVKTFQQFQEDTAAFKKTPKLKYIINPDIENLYNAAQHLDPENWGLFFEMVRKRYSVNQN